MIARNDITGDFIKTKGASNSFRDGWDRIFGKKEPQAPVPEPTVEPVESKHDQAKLEEDALRQEWWQYCQDNQKSMIEPGAGGTLIPSFEEWKKLAGKM